MHSALLKPYDECLNLIRVVGRFWQDASLEKPMLVGVVLGFEQTIVSLSVTADDEIEVAADVSVNAEAIEEIDISEVPPWKATIGRPLLWVGVMTNQQGYSDGIQLEFAEDTAAESVIVQLIALGAQLRIRAISPNFLP